MGTILVVHDELNSLELSIFKKDDKSKPELRYFPNYMNNGRCKYGRVCQFAHSRKELMKYSLCVCWRDS